MKKLAICMALAAGGCATAPSAPDALDGLSEAIIRHDIPNGYIGSNRSFVLYVRVGERDISLEARKRLSADEIDVPPSSAWTPGAGMMVHIPDRSLSTPNAMQSNIARTAETAVALLLRGWPRSGGFNGSLNRCGLRGCSRRAGATWRADLYGR